MNVTTLVALIEHYGYAALFFSLWLGIVGMPIPDEAIVMTGGAVIGLGILKPLPTFVLVYLGVISGLSLGYVLGRFVGTPILEKIRRKKNVDRYIAYSEQLLQKYGNFAVCISYMLPVVRHIVPYLVGINKMSYKRYALLSYSSGLVWTLIFLTLGRVFGNQVQAVGDIIHHYGMPIAMALIVLTAGFVIIKYRMTVQRSDKNNRA
ncbi:DedA family protein [Paenibacillus thalictri]|uniref:DedA family protein n=1 Tax=Paenibacillus thalictri TaxID=2527873 RepID=A0A4V2J409_9BACL|nr:DedA family protein [Paenibacillus thalictri]TBL76645.1 DedA family protein [Paenibacillus thalictri]